MEQRPESESDVPGAVRLLRIQVGERAYALEVGYVDRVTSVPQLTPVPHAPDAIAGVGRTDGEVVLYLDGGVLTGAEDIELGTAVLLERPDSGMPVGLLATGTEGMESVSVDRIVPGAKAGLDTAVFAAGITGGDGRVPLFGPERLATIADQRRS